MSELEFNNIGKEVIVVNDEEVSIDGVNINDLFNELKGSNLFDEYMSEMLWGSYEGFEKNDIIGIMRLLKDMVLYKNNK